MVIIAAGFKARSGKDFFCKSIIQKFGDQYDIRKYAFADQLKEEVYYKLYNRDDDVWKQISYPVNLLPKNDGLSVENPIEYIDRNRANIRPVLQQYGTLKRLENPFYWISALNKKLNRERPTVALISDLRYINEFQYVKSLSGYTVKIDRIGFLDPTVDSSHQSECDLINTKFDFEISCLDGDIDSLRRDSIEVFNIIKEGLTNEFPTLEDLTVCSYQKKATN